MDTFVNVSASTETPHSTPAVARRSLRLRGILLAGALSLVAPLVWAGAAYAGCSAG